MENERPIEKLLRRYAKKRRDEAGAPIELHPATRRMLQGEVKRQYPQQSTGGDVSFGQVLRNWLPWLGWAGATALVISVGVLMFFSGSETGTVQMADERSQPVQLAKNIEPTPRDLEKSSEPAPQTPSPERKQKFSEQTTASAPREEFAPREVAEGPERDVLSEGRADGPAPQLTQRSVAPTRSRSFSDSTPAPAARAESVEEPREYFNRQTAADASNGIQPARAARRGVAETAAVPAPIPPGSAVGQAQAFAGAELRKAEEPVGNFAGVAGIASYTNLGANVSSSPVLLQFQIQQVGDELRVIDSDGSIYLGRMPAANDEASFGEGVKDARALASDMKITNAVLEKPVRVQAESVSYQVQGTNRTLNQSVVFTWNFVPITNTEAKLGVSELQPTQSQTPQVAPALLDAQISGRAQLPNGREIRVNAIPTKP